MDDITRRSVLPALAVTSIALISEANAANVKISAFPNASLSMGSGDRVTGLQSGANVNFSSSQILGGGFITTYGSVYFNSYYGAPQMQASNAAAASGYDGSRLYIKSGTGDGAGKGGGLYLYGGYGGASGIGGNVKVQSGRGTSGGVLFLKGGASFGMAGTGGNVLLYGGNNAAGFGGNVFIGGGTGNSSFGAIKMLNLPTTDPSDPNAIFSNNKVLMQSGVTNANGAYTIAGIGSKTITIVNGIITSIA